MHKTITGAVAGSLAGIACLAMGSGGASATLTGTGLARSTSCCRPTAGTLAINQTGGTAPGQHTWTFTSTCGSATLDGKTVTLPACL